jgi:hypothetical protein
MSYHSDLVEHYKAVKSRLNAPPPKPVDKVLIENKLPVDNSKIIQESPEVIEFAQEISLALLYKLVYDNTQPVKRKLWKDVIADVEKKTGFLFLDIISPRRPAPLCEARQYFYWKCHKELPWISIAEIGRRCGKDHTTVLHGIKVCDKKRLYDKFEK